MPGKLIPDHLVERWEREGLTDAQIVRRLAEEEHVTVTRQAISAWRKRRGEDMRPQPPRAIPWDLRPEHRTMEAARAIRFYARVQRGETIPEEDRVRMQRVVDELHRRNAVLWYERDTVEGWFMVPRRPEDGDGIIRQP